MSTQVRVATRKADFLPAYFQVVFFGRPLPRGFPRSFAIVTGYSPTGTDWPKARNLQADKQLKERTARWKPHRIIGSSPDRQHEEPGWAVACSRSTAVRIGREFHQDAVFWVENDVLIILDTKFRRPAAKVGSFKTRLFKRS